MHLYKTKWIVLLLILASFKKGIGQEGYFPPVGDTMYFLVDRMPENVSVNDRGSHARWDISMAKAPFLRPVVAVNPAEVTGVDHFPETNYAIKSHDQTIQFYRKEGRELYLLGQFGFYVNDQFVPVVVEYDIPLLINDPDASRQQKWEYTSRAEIVFPTSMLHPEFKSLLPVAADSARIQMTVNRVTRLDAFGELKYQIIFDHADRYFTIEKSEYKFQLRVGNKPWQDFTRYVDLEKLFGPGERHFYDFKGEKSGISVAHVEVDPATRQAMSVEYWVRSYLDRFQRAKDVTAADIFAFPNPAIGFVNIELNNLKPGNYKVVLYNFLAQEVYKMPVEVISNRTIQIDVSEFEKGPYLYGLVDSYGRRIMTKRLTILQP